MEAAKAQWSKIDAYHDCHGVGRKEEREKEAQKADWGFLAGEKNRPMGLSSVSTAT